MLAPGDGNPVRGCGHDANLMLHGMYRMTQPSHSVALCTHASGNMRELVHSQIALTQTRAPVRKCGQGSGGGNAHIKGRACAHRLRR